MKNTDFEMLYIAMVEMGETPESEGLHAGLGYACKEMGIRVDVQHHKEIQAFYGRHRAKLVNAFKAGKERFMAVCDACAKRDDMEGNA